MTQITIGGVEMPKTRQFEIGGEIVAVEATMASGKLVRDVIGWRTVLTAFWEWLPQDTLAQIVALARGGGFVAITYPDTDGTAATGTFSISIGSQKVFKFVDGSPMWCNVSLTATSQEVTDYASG